MELSSELSEKTGGDVISSTDLESSWQDCGKGGLLLHADLCPRALKNWENQGESRPPGLPGDLRRQPAYGLHQRVSAEKAGAKSEIRIEGLSLEKKRLSFTLCGYSLAKKRTGSRFHRRSHCREERRKPDAFNEKKHTRPTLRASIVFRSADAGAGPLRRVGGRARQGRGKTANDFIQPLVE